jgi:hypothetical protein
MVLSIRKISKDENWKGEIETMGEAIMDMDASQ